MSSSVSSNRSLWADLRASIRGVPYDFTEGSLGRAILLLSVPMVLEMFMQAVFEVADIFFVGRLGADAVAAVGLAASLVILVFAVGIGLSMAAAAMVARRIGERDPEGAAAAAVQALAVSLVFSLPVAALGIGYAPELLRLMGATEHVVAAGTGYTAVLLGTNTTILFLFLINAIFRGAGDAALAMRALWLANVLNIVLDPLFIFGWGPFPELGVTGAAVATAVGRGIGVGYQCHALLRGRSRIRIRRHHLRPDPGVIRRLLRVSGTGILQYLIGTASWLGVIRIIATFGSAAVAGYTIAVRVIIFALLPSWGLGNAAATLVGQNLGAKKPERAARAVWITAFVNTAFLGLVALAIQFVATPLVMLFTTDPAVIPYGTACLRIVSYSYVFWAFGMVVVQAFNGAGDTDTPTWINLVCFWLIQIPLAYLLARPLEMGPNGVFAAIAIAQAILAVLGVLAFRQGRWKRKVI
ncbi:MATE family efflux transporter [Rhodocaloribacter litoris]|uniref:MATE family efflux transporter n=1 Tax=Rhodocaloribacter litoris TaxID=2558931 RepID=UPI0014230844|nr:MATE family efflux transporter [Rhodocaloribacter litoris]QXD14993.1 MATE family efflux transporter [Rhodocaloribacter litoris]